MVISRNWARRIAFGITTLTGAAFIAIACNPNPAHAATCLGVNPWNLNMTNADKTKDGLTITGTTNSLAQILTVKDPYGAPIFSVGHVGGATVFGDHIRLIGDAGFNTPVVDMDTHGTISITGTNPKVVINGQALTAADIAWIHAHE